MEKNNLNENEEFKYKGEVVYRFDYHWTDDQAYNRGYPDNKEYFIGTEAQFKEMVCDLQNGFGFSCWDVKTRKCNKEEFEEYRSWFD